MIFRDLTATVGGTPLVDLARVAPDLPGRVLASALGDAVEDGRLEVGVQLLLAREELIEERVHPCPLDARCDEFPARRRSPAHERSPRAHLGLG